MSGKQFIGEDVAWGPSGLVTGVVQDAADGRVLMVAYVDAEALAATLASGDVHFHSRSRDRLWRKGESSGNVLRLVDISIDCDGDAILFQVNPTGPTCHRNTRSCFDAANAVVAPASVAGAVVSTASAGSAAPLPAVDQDFAWLETLWATIDARATADPTTSYTSRLVAGGVDAPARKVTEEATEVLMAAKDDAVARPDARAKTRDDLTGEVADLLYHTLVLLRERGLPPAAVIARLRERHKA
jgi:phosphoribosyl-ATP pyrophosphohydrolase/phosphoribosyl-AMP cyclohydrolase